MVRLGSEPRQLEAKSPLVAVNEHHPIWDTITEQGDPFSPTGTVLAELKQIDADLGLEGGQVGGEGRMIVAGTASVHDGGNYVTSWWFWMKPR